MNDNYQSEIILMDDIKYPKISIITVCFNSIKTINQTIHSVINQTYPNIEYIIIDGGSVDGSVDIIKEYQERITYWVSEPDSGIYDAMNKGINIATGDYIQFLGSDDCLASYETIEQIAILLSENRSIDALSTSVLVVDEKYKIQFTGKSKFSQEELYLGFRIPHQGLFMKASILKTYLFDTQYKIAADYDLFLKLHFDSNISFIYLDKIAAFYSLEGISSKNLMEKCKEDIAIMNKYKFPKEYIKRYENLNKKNNYKMVLKKILNILGLLRYFLLLHGWEEHTCSLKICRWCK